MPAKLSLLYERLLFAVVPRTGITDPGCNRIQVSISLPNTDRILSTSSRFSIKGIGPIQRSRFVNLRSRPL